MAKVTVSNNYANMVTDDGFTETFNVKVTPITKGKKTFYELEGDMNDLESCIDEITLGDSRSIDKIFDTLQV